MKQKITPFTTEGSTRSLIFSLCTSASLCLCGDRGFFTTETRRHRGGTEN
jgi:hypothetical protein